MVASRLTLALALALGLLTGPALSQTQITCVGFFGIGAYQGTECKPFPGRKAKISIGQLADTVADTRITEIRLISDDKPDQAFDLSPLAGASHIRTLDIYREGEIDPAPVLAMQGLKSLSLSIDAARALPQLARNGATGPAGLAGLRLYIPRDTVDLAPLSGWSGLRLLDIDAATVTGTDALATLTVLLSVDIDIKTPADFTPLGAATGLRDLTLRGVLGGQAVSDIAFLARLTDLHALTLDTNSVTDLAPLSGLTGLRTLVLSRNAALTDLAPIAGLTDLRNLQLRGTGVSDLSPLRDMSKLTILWLDRTPVSDISVLAGMPEMFGLELSRTKVNDLSPLEGLAGLKHLSVRGAPVTDFSPVPAWTRIKN